MEKTSTDTGIGIGMSARSSASDRQWSCAAGDEVFGCDEHKLGKVKEVHPGYVVVSQGLIVHTSLYVPTDAINNCEGGRVYLSVTKDEAAKRGWDAPPASASGSEAATTTM
jgi:hypothetical protein